MARYVPSERDQWARNNKLHDMAVSQQNNAARDARKIMDSIAGLVEKEREKTKRAAKDIRTSIRVKAAAEEKRILTTPVTQYSGGSHANPKPIVVWHWRVPMPANINTSVNGIKRSDAAPLLSLKPGGGVDNVPAALRSRLGGRDGFSEWASSTDEVLAEVERRYPIIARLRDDEFLAHLLGSAGVIKPDTSSIEEHGTYGVYKRPVNLVTVPVLTAVEVTPEGLELVFAHNSGDTAADWAKQLAGLRAEFNASGVHDASHLRITEDVKDASIRLRFDDAPSSFPRAIAPPPVLTSATVEEARRNYQNLEWKIGVDARGNELATSVIDVFHTMVVGETGAGKSVWINSLIEAWRPNGKVFLIDPKGVDYIALENTPGVVMRSETPAQHVVLVGEVVRELKRRERAAARGKRSGEGGGFGFEALLFVVDELSSLRIDIEGQWGVSGDKAFMRAVDLLLRKGRAFGIHVVLGNQDLYAESLPLSMQNNCQMLVALGTLTDRTLFSKFFPENVKDAAVRIGQRISSNNKGRALFVDREHGTVSEVQTYYAWSPGTTSLAPDAAPKVAPPTDEVRAAWEAADKVCQSLPRLYPRLGIKVDGPEWAEDTTVADLLNVPTVVLDDENMKPIPELLDYDHRRELDWIGAETWDDDDDPSTPEVVRHRATPKAESGVPAESLTPEQVASMTAEERDAWMREHARAQGYDVPDDDDGEAF